MKSFPIEGVENGKVLLVKSEGKISAIGTKCTHYGAPLEKGVVCNGQVKCPFHGACFSLATGDIEEFPGLDSIPKYDVQVTNGKVKIRGSRKQIEENRRIKTMAKYDPSNEQVYALIGGGAASLKCAETLRQEGFTGRIELYTQEDVLPYDRPKLSKAMHLKADALALRSKAFFEEADINVHFNSSVSLVDAASMSFTLANGTKHNCTKMFIATGGIPRNLRVPGAEMEGTYLLRTPSDANLIAEAAKGKHVVIIGSSFIGMEAAAYFATDKRVASVTVIGSSSVPFERSLGEAIGSAIQGWFEKKGIAFINNTKIQKIEGEEGKLEKIIVNENTFIECDVIVAGLGVEPATEFLSESGVHLDERRYVPVNEFMETNVPGIYCGGDIAAFPLFLQDGNRVSIGHWQIAHNHGHVAAQNMVGKATPVRTVPFFWTVLFGKSLRYAGYGSFDDVIVHGNPSDLSFIAYYCKGAQVVAVSSLMKDPAVAKFAGHLQAGKSLLKEEVLQDPEIALKL